MNNTIRISPSILSGDFSDLKASVKSVENADYLHVDVIDGHFAPNLTFGLPVVKKLAEISPIPLDIHLMIENPDFWAPQYVFENVSSITFHYGAVQAPIRLAQKLQKLGVKAAIALRPHESIQNIIDIVPFLDMVLIMTVEPGFSGQKFIPTQFGKIRELREKAATINPDLIIQVDGGVSVQNINSLFVAGATNFVGGSSIFDTANPSNSISLLRKAALESKI